MKQVCVLGCGAMGTMLSNLVADNVQTLEEYANEIKWYVRDEDCDGERLIESLRKNRENFKYIPGVRISDRIIICGDVVRVASAADVLLVAYATRHIHEILEVIKPHLKPGVLIISFSKGLIVSERNSFVHASEIRLVSEEIRNVTGIECVVVSGALTARGMANGDFAEVTAGSFEIEKCKLAQKILQNSRLSVTCVQDPITVEVCGALKNVVGVAAGIVDGLKLGANTKSAILRLGLYEIDEYCRFMFSKYNTKRATMLESCGVSEIFLCMLRQSDQMPQVGDDWDAFNLLIGRMLTDPEYSQLTLEEIEQSLHPEYVATGPDTARKIHNQLSSMHLCEKYPLFTAVHLISSRIIPATMLLHLLTHHPAHV